MPKSHLLQAKIVEAKTRVNNNIPSDSENLYYVNGLLKNRNRADKALAVVNKYFSPRRFKLIYNNTEGVSDIQEIKQDYNWLKQTAYSQVLNSIIPNDAMYRTMAILDYGRENNVRIGFVGSSQGSLIIYNAILCYYLLDASNRNYLNTMVRLGTVGSLIPEIHYGLGEMMIEQFSAHVNRYDIISNLFTSDDNLEGLNSLRGSGRHSIKWYLPNNAYHRSFHRIFTRLDPYEPHLEKDYFD